jgi:hypothetical protein
MGLVTNSVGPSLSVIKQILSSLRAQIKFVKASPQLIAIVNYNTKCPYAVKKAVSAVSVFKAVLFLLCYRYMFRLLPINSHYINEKST